MSIIKMRGPIDVLFAFKIFSLPVPIRPGTRTFWQVPDPSHPEVKNPYPSNPAHEPKSTTIRTRSSWLNWALRDDEQLPIRVKTEKKLKLKNKRKPDPVGSTVRYEMMKPCTGSVIGHYEAAAVGTWWYWVSKGHLCHTWYLSFFLHGQNFSRIKFTQKNAIFFALNL